MCIVIPSAVNFIREIHELIDVVRLLFLPKIELNLPRYSFPALKGKPRIAIKIINYLCHCILDNFSRDSQTANTTQRRLIVRSSHFPPYLGHLARCPLIVDRLIMTKNEVTYVWSIKLPPLVALSSMPAPLVLDIVRDQRSNRQFLWVKEYDHQISSVIQNNWWLSNYSE